MSDTVIPSTTAEPQAPRAKRKPTTTPTLPAPRPTPTGTALRTDTAIQGNVLAAFNKDHQVFLMMRFGHDRAHAQTWVQHMLPFISTNDRVAAFNEAFSSARRASGSDPESLTATWVSLSLTGDGLHHLAPAATDALGGLTGIDAGVAAWLAGAEAAAATVGDTDESAPERWLFGSAATSVHAIVCVAADRRDDLDTALATQRELAARYGMSIVFEQVGETLPDGGRGHEHFGFKDGISQPGVIGFDAPDADDPTQVAGKPGTDLIAPGEFVLGYERQGGGTRAVPSWMWDGSFLVLRRLAQDVPGFWADMERAADTLSSADRGGDTGILDAEGLAARLVGRWRNGTPTDRCPMSDVAPADDPGLNDFSFGDDADGIRTPHAAHIRKVYPREGAESAPITVTEEDAEKRRILRRGIPFGRTFEPATGHGHGVDSSRGLVFQCYQASLPDQFLFLQQRWVNFDKFPTVDAGKDAVIGQASTVSVRPNGTVRTMQLRQWVHTQGSVFAFTPSLPTLRALAAGRELPIADEIVLPPR